MKRLALVLAASVMGTGCFVSSDHGFVGPTGTLDMAWLFVRTKDDTSTVSYTCARAGIDSVTVAYSLGGTRTVACNDGTLDGFVDQVAPAGTQTVTLTGYRGSAPLYQTSYTVTVPQNATQTLDAQLFGIPDDLDIFANFLDRNGAFVGWSTCGLAGVSRITWSLEDWAGTIVASGSAPCTDPAGVSYGGPQALDRDQYAIRMQGFPPVGAATFDSATTRVSPTCDGQAFNHYGPSVGSFAWDVLLFDVSTNPTLCL